MSMLCKLFALSDKQARSLLEHPETVHDFITQNDNNEDLATALSLEKSWHGLHFALNQSQWDGEPPLNFLMAGEVVGEEDLGYGPGRILLSQEVLAIDKALTNFSDADFERNFDLDAMASVKIYPTSLWEKATGLSKSSQSELLAELLEEYRAYFEQLKQFVRLAGENNQAILITVR